MEPHEPENVFQALETAATLFARRETAASEPSRSRLEAGDAGK